MRTDLDHLPADKRRELDRVVQILFEEFTSAFGKPEEGKKLGKILKIILYGSYARGGWVDEPHTAKGYRSDFDLLIIVNQDELTDRVRFWLPADERLTRELAITKTLKTPVNFIVHTLQQVNDGLAHGRYFFMDVAADGVALYQSDDSDLHTPKPKTAVDALKLATEYFEEWFPAAADFKDSADHLASKGKYKRSAFLLHQAAEQLYHCALLVLTSYTPHVHNLKFLRTQAERASPKLYSAWPRNSNSEKALFEKLKDAYVKARYSKNYKITEEEIAWLGSHIESLGGLVHDVCLTQIENLRSRSLAA